MACSSSMEENVDSLLGPLKGLAEERGEVGVRGMLGTEACPDIFLWFTAETKFAAMLFSMCLIHARG